MKARIQLKDRTSGDALCPTPVVTLNVRDRYGTFAPLLFRVDSQADVVTIPIDRAGKETIPFNRSRPGVAVGHSGRVGKFRGRVRLLIAGREHDWPCDFVESAVDPDTKLPLPTLSPVLGRAGFLDEYAIAVDDNYLIITRLGPLRRWFRRLLHRLWHVSGRIYPTDQPL